MTPARPQGPTLAFPGARARAALLGAGALIGLSAALLDRFVPTPSRAAEPPPADAHTARGLLHVLARTWSEFNQDQIPAVAAGVTFFGLLAVFPAIGAFVSLYGLVADVADARRQLGALAGVLPGGAISVITDQIDHITATDHGRLGMTLVVSLLLSLWSANAGVKALIAGLNIAFEARERRGFLVLNAISLAFTLGVVVFSLLSLLAVSLGPELLERIGLGGLGWTGIVRWPLLVAFVFGFLSLLYRFGACRRESRWRLITPGSAVACFGWLAMSLTFSWYVAHFGNYDRTYGSLGAVVGFMTWIWLSNLVVLFGAELNNELETAGVGSARGTQLARRRSPGPSGPGDQP